MAYDALPVNAFACTECGACVERCPFGVNVILRMKQAVDLFGWQLASRSDLKLDKEQPIKVKGVLR